jgi:hypothetical protein
MNQKQTYLIKDVNCDNGELNLIVVSYSDLVTHQKTFEHKYAIQPQELKRLSEKFGVKWDGTRESVDKLKNKLIELKLE